jgi:hypothetical protein
MLSRLSLRMDTSGIHTCMCLLITGRMDREAIMLKTVSENNQIIQSIPCHLAFEFKARRDLTITTENLQKALAVRKYRTSRM